MMKVSDMSTGRWYDVHTQMQDGEIVKQRVEKIGIGDEEMPEVNYVMSKEGRVDLIVVPIYEWEPQPDITVYELACAMRYLLTNRTRGIKDETESVRRHFRDVAA